MSSYEHRQLGTGLCIVVGEEKKETNQARKKISLEQLKTGVETLPHGHEMPPYE